jgi:light-regulated signal transduction histidine kinase (bacteriophytochrome)
MKASARVIENEQNENMPENLSLFPRSASINLSTLVVQVITDFISERPDVKATFEVENNIIVKGDYQKLSQLLKNIISTSFLLNLSSQHHSLIFARSRDEHQTFFIMNSELGNTSGVSFGAFGYLDKKELGPELQVMQAIVASHNGKFRAIGKKDIGSIFYFSLGE